MAARPPEGTGPRGRSRADRRAPLLPGEGPLSRVPPALVLVVVLAAFAVAVVLGGPVGAVVLGVLALAVAGLLAATWPRLSPAERAGRILVLAVLVAVAVAQVGR